MCSNNMQIQNSFKCLLEDVKKSEFLWATRYINFVNAYKNFTQPTLHSEEIRKYMIENQELIQNLGDVSITTINYIVKEMAGSFSLPIVRWLGYILAKILSKTLSNLYVNEAQIIQIRNNMGKNPVIFLPGHRSYADFILMAFLTFHYNIQLPYVAAGMDFHSMKFMGEVLRRSKAFFIRRQFTDDQIYKTIFKTYFQLLIELGESPIEFFIEGTRSRSSKTLPPKFGLLSMLVETYYKGKVPDITLIPISITYERLLEEQLFAYEHLGVPKPKESTLRMFKAFKNLDGKYGRIFLNFGNSINLREWTLSNFKHENLKNINLSEVTNCLAHDIIKRQIDLQIVTPFHILAIIINQKTLTTKTYTIKLEEVICEFEFILKLMQLRHAIISIEDDIQNSIRKCAEVHSSLIEIKNDIMIVKSFNNHANNICILQGVYNANLLNDLIPRIINQLYINPNIHLFIGPALLLMSLGPAEQIYKGSVLEAFKFICKIFMDEFVSLCDVELEDLYNESIIFMRATECLTQNLQKSKSYDKIKDFLWILLFPFFASYALLADVMFNFKIDKLWTKNDLITNYEFVVGDILNQGFLHPYCLSKDLIKNAMDSFVKSNFINTINNDSGIHFISNHEDLKQFLHFTTCAMLFIDVKPTLNCKM